MCQFQHARHSRIRTPRSSASDTETLGRTDSVRSPFQTRIRTPDFSTSDTEVLSIRTPDTTFSPEKPQESREKRDQKLYLQPTCTTQDVVTSVSGLAMNQAAEKPPTMPEGIPEKCRSSGRCPLPVLGSVPVPLPVHSGFQCPEVPMSPGASTRGSNVSVFQCPEGGKTWLS